MYELKICTNLTASVCRERQTTALLVRARTEVKISQRNIKKFLLLSKRTQKSANLFFPFGKQRHFYMFLYEMPSSPRPEKRSAAV